ncbi:hypothetical protein ACOMHN_051092 [Nucella lapillus]
MADLWQAVREAFWSENFWLPEYLTWADMKNNDPSIYKPQTADLINPVYLCFVICGIRIVFERCVDAVVSRRFKLRSRVRKAPANPTLEAQYLTAKSPSPDTLQVGGACEGKSPSPDTLQVGAACEGKSPSPVTLQVGAACEGKSPSPDTLQVGAACEGKSPSPDTLQVGAACEGKSPSPDTLQVGAACEGKSPSPDTLQVGAACEGKSPSPDTLQVGAACEGKSPSPDTLQVGAACEGKSPSPDTLQVGAACEGKSPSPDTLQVGAACEGKSPSPDKLQVGAACEGKSPSPDTAVWTTTTDAQRDDALASTPGAERQRRRTKVWPYASEPYAEQGAHACPESDQGHHLDPCVGSVTHCVMPNISRVSRNLVVVADANTS